MRAARWRVDASRLESSGGFSLPELLISVTILLIISSTVTSALLQMTNSQHTIWNRTQLHAGVRSATELLQQEVGQAGRVTLPYTTKLTSAVAGGATTIGLTQTINSVDTASVAGVFVGEQLTVDAGGNQETVAVTAVDTNAKQITATFGAPHPAASPVQVLGGFASGIVPPTKADGTVDPNGSTATKLKMFGDINGDGNMVYVEYWCDTASGNLYRNVMAWNAAAKPAVTASQVLLGNVLPNPGGTACFTYMPSPLPVVNNSPFVLDVAITLTVQTQELDRITRQYQTETKALLNVSPRNVFNVWELASASGVLLNRIQPVPPQVQNLLP